MTRPGESNNEFDNVEQPSPVLSPTHQGLDGLSESLAHLMNYKQHSNSKVQNSRQETTGGLNASKDHMGPGRLDLATSGKHADQYDTMGGHAASSTNRPMLGTMRSDDAVFNQHSTTKLSKALQPRLSPQVADIASKSPSKVSSSLTSAAAVATGSHGQPFVGASAAGMLRKASADKQASGTSSHVGSPPESGYSTPRILHSGKEKPQVLETHHLQLQTHGPSGRRMINQYIIETELGRGVHGKVRLARDTDTGERVAVKIVEREGKKRLGGPSGWHAKVSGLEETASSRKDKAAERRADGVISVDMAAPSPPFGTPVHETPGPHTRFAGPSVTPPRSPGATSNRGSVPPSPASLAAAARYGRWGSGAPSRPTYGDKEAERLREKEKEKARKRLLWTTDKKVKREIALLKKCAHENVVRLKEVIDDPSSKKIFMVLEFMEGGEVHWKDERGFPTLTVDEARKTLRDVVLGLEYLHYQGIIHRDIKPANLLWDANRRVKISDFGVSHFSYALLVASGGLPSQDSDEERMKDPSLVDDHELAKTAGSPAFFAPELCLTGEPMHTTNSQPSTIIRTGKVEDGAGFPWIQADRGSPLNTPKDEAGSASSKAFNSLGRKSRPPITKAIDIWALGVTLYCLLFGHVPFTADSEFELFAVIPREDYELPAFMGADRIQIGPRKKRWISLPQWRDEEADVDRESESGSEQTNVDVSTLCEEARLVRDLLDRLLEKDPSKRIKLEEVKMHPWVVQDIADPPLWLSETDPAQLPFVQVSNEEVEGALTGFSKIKQTLKKFQSKLFAGLGVQSHHHHHAPMDRTDQQHRRLQTSGGAVRRQRSKSASQLHGPPALTFTPSDNKASVKNESSGQSAPATTMHSPKGSYSHRPHHFFSRRQSTALLTPDHKSTIGPTSATLRAEKAISQSQPNSRPHSPAGIDSSLQGKQQFEGSMQFEKGQHSTLRRPSSFFRKTASKGGEPREGIFVQRKNQSTDGLGSLSVHPQDYPLPSSRPSSKAGTIRTNGGSTTANNMAKSDSSPAPRSSQESDAANWTFVSASQSGNSTLQRSLSNRPRSRSKLSDVFRNVLGSNHQGGGSDRHQGRLRSRPGTAASHHAAPSPSFERSVAHNSSNRNPAPALLAPLTLVHPEQSNEDVFVPPLEKEKEGEKDEANSRAGQISRTIEVDDYDVDLDLSDDDLDEAKANEEQRLHTILRNAGNGWVMERGDSSTSSSSSNRARYPLDSINLESLTPSVEGGYNLFKPPYTGIVKGGKEEIGKSHDANSYAMTQVHSDEAEALRRASAKVGDSRLDSDLEQSDHHHITTATMDTVALGDVSTTSDERFADAEEVSGHNLAGPRGKGQDDDDGDEDEDEDEDEDGGVSFQAKKRVIS